MRFYDLRAIVASGKRRISLNKPSDSFYVVEGQDKPYIEPTFEKVVFEEEKPTIILVSAVGATGKTALARKLSKDLQLPVLDLAQHKAVGDNTLTGLITHSFAIEDVSAVLSGLATGKFGVIIDGIDEGRSKTSDAAFRAFLDDIASLCSEDSPTTFVLLGRTKILEDCWDYFEESSASVGLATILPFSVDEARTYINTFTNHSGLTNKSQYEQARDRILEKLSGVFAGEPETARSNFTSFIGYPPVLDAIVTLLTEEKNYHKLLNELDGEVGDELEIGLLLRIGNHILARERTEKVLPNIVEQLVQDRPGIAAAGLREAAFTPIEQCVRLVAFCTKEEIVFNPFKIPHLDEEYEERLQTFFHEHPFLESGGFRNSVFESLALATLVCSDDQDHVELAQRYFAGRKHSYHFVFMLSLLAEENLIPATAIGMLIASSMEFRSVKSDVDVSLDSVRDLQDTEGLERPFAVEISIEITRQDGSQADQTLVFSTELTSNSEVKLGTGFGGVYFHAPCAVTLGDGIELSLTAPVNILARKVAIEAQALILHPQRRDEERQSEVFLEVESLDSKLHEIKSNGVPIVFSVGADHQTHYPIAPHTVRRSLTPTDPNFKQYYLRLKRILMEFRSHSRGSMARYRQKIEHDRVLKGDIGRTVLAKLIDDGVIILDGKFYHLSPEKLANRLGVTYQDLRNGVVPETLRTYIGTIG